jgi:FkbM family methyltransferase
VTSTNRKLVYDIGAHLGEDVDLYRKLGYDVVAVEANPALADKLRTRFADDIAGGHCTVVECAVAETAGTATFYVNDHLSVWGTLEAWRNERNLEMGTSSVAIDVECRPLADLFAEYGVPDFVKIDVEGVDAQVVQSMLDAPRVPRMLSMESSENSIDDVAAELDVLYRLGYREFKVVRQGLHRLRGTRWRSVSGTVVHHAFSSASSGPPPDLVRGRWLTREQALAKYRRVYVVYRLLGGTSRLQRSLARFPKLRRAVGFACGWYDTHARLSDDPGR